LNAHLAKSILHVVELERLDDGLDFFHGDVTLPSPCFQHIP
jgi:hypothetical protein